MSDEELTSTPPELRELADIMRKTYKSSTLWKTYSMLRLMINIRQNVDISKFMKLQAFLKRLSVGFVPKKWKLPKCCQTVVDLHQLDSLPLLLFQQQLLVPMLVLYSLN
ncbi:hypothetical protein PPYR_03769 [Photinus pyralis]|uniref:Uncharacterized protein n=1 Tax=Photinus pyralis TaxID=7054 RepID=A0A5N4AWE6_PHOPY|nr:hypothetical protein PPYR_03769 [Photinus pyralis]